MLVRIQRMKLNDIIPKLKLLQAYEEMPEILVTNYIKHIPAKKASPSSKHLRRSYEHKLFLQTNII